MGELAKRLPALLADADRRGDLYTSVNLRIGYTNLMWLAADDVASARRHVKEAMAVWSHETFSIQHYRAMLAGANIDLYVGDGASAYDGVERVWKKLQATMLLRVQYMRADANFLRARCAIASLGEGAHRRARLVEIRELAKRLERERMPWIAPLAAIISAAASEAEGDRSAAAMSLRAAIDLANAADMSLHAAAARHQLGSMLGGEEGGALVREACQAMTAQGVRNPAGFASMLVPGSWAAC
jgi:hypothetical protein